MTDTLATRERRVLADDMLRAGPDAPTLCEGWTVRDLAAHLWVRDNQPWNEIGAGQSPLARVTDAAMARAARRPFTELVDDVRRGPVWRLNPTRLPRLNDLANTGEMFIHHEDVRRGAGDLTPRAFDAADTEALWAQARQMAKLSLLRCPVGVSLQRPGDRAMRVKSGSPMVTLVGTAGELLLYLSGRRESAHVELHGSPDAVTAFQAHRTGL